MKRLESTAHGLSAKITTGVLGLFLTCTIATLATAQSGNLFLDQQEDQLKLSAHFQLEENTRTGYLVLTAKIPEGSYIYSLTQKGNPPPSKIEIATSEQFEVSGTFKPEFPPTVVEQDPDFGVRTEKHKKSLRFFIPLQLSATTSPETLNIRLRFNGQVCSDEGTCMPIRDKVLEASFSGYFQRVAQRNESGGTERR